MKRLNVTWMVRSDLPALIEIDPEWNEGTFRAHLTQRHCIGMVCHTSGVDEMMGFMIYELYADYIHVVRIRGSHIAVGAMLAKLETKLSPHRRSYFTVAESERGVLCDFLEQLAVDEDEATGAGCVSVRNV